jgi:hypothetical protein
VERKVLRQAVAAAIGNVNHHRTPLAHGIHKGVCLIVVGLNRHRCSKCNSQEVGDHPHKVNSIMAGECQMLLNSKPPLGPHKSQGNKQVGVRKMQQRALGVIRLGMSPPLAHSRIAGVSSKRRLPNLALCHGVQPPMLSKHNLHNNMAQHRAGANRLMEQDNREQLTPGEPLLLLHNTIPPQAFQLLPLPLLDGSRQVWGK